MDAAACLAGLSISVAAIILQLTAPRVMFEAARLHDPRNRIGGHLAGVIGASEATP